MRAADSDDNKMVGASPPVPSDTIELQFIMNKLIACGTPEAKEIRGKYYPVVPYVEMAKWVREFVEAEKLTARLDELKLLLDDPSFDTDTAAVKYHIKERRIAAIEAERRQIGEDSV